MPNDLVGWTVTVLVLPSVGIVIGGLALVLGWLLTRKREGNDVR